MKTAKRSYFCYLAGALLALWWGSPFIKFVRQGDINTRDGEISPYRTAIPLRSGTIQRQACTLALGCSASIVNGAGTAQLSQQGPHSSPKREGHAALKQSSLDRATQASRSGQNKSLRIAYLLRPTLPQGNIEAREGTHIDTALSLRGSGARVSLCHWMDPELANARSALQGHLAALVLTPPCAKTNKRTSPPTRRQRSGSSQR